MEARKDPNRLDSVGIFSRFALVANSPIARKIHNNRGKNRKKQSKWAESPVFVGFSGYSDNPNHGQCPYGAICR